MRRKSASPTLYSLALRGAGAEKTIQGAAQCGQHGWTRTHVSGCALPHLVAPDAHHLTTEVVDNLEALGRGGVSSAPKSRRPTARSRFRQRPDLSVALQALQRRIVELFRARGENELVCRRVEEER